MAGSGKRRVWVVGAGSAVAVVVVAVSWTLLRGGDDDTADVTAGANGYLLAGDLLEDWEVAYAATPETIAELAAAEADGVSGMVAEVAGEVVVYGDRSLEEPWDGPLLALMRFDGSPGHMTAPPASVLTEEVTAGDDAFTVYETGDVVSASAEDGPWLMAYGVEREAVEAALDHLDTEPAIDDDGLPGGYEEIARGPLGAANLTPHLLGASGGLTVGYGQQSIYETSPDITLTQQAADSDTAAGLVRLGMQRSVYGYPTESEADVVDIRGNEAHVVRQDGVNPGNGEEGGLTAYQWFEPSVGQVVTVMATGVEQATVDAFVDGLGVAGDAEVEELVAQEYSWLEPESGCGGSGSATVEAGSASSGSAEGPSAEGSTPAPDELPLQDGATVLADGQEEAVSWQLSVRDDGDGCGSLSLATAHGTGSGSSSISLYDRLTEASTSIVDHLSGDTGTQPVFGLVAEAVAEVRLEHSGGDSYALEVHDLEGFEANAFVGVVPSEATAYELVALDDNGEVLDEWSAPARGATDVGSETVETEALAAEE